MRPISFGSDNHSGIHPQILQAIADSNQGSAASYEMDEESQELKKFIKTEFGCADSFLVMNGTAANVLSLNCGVQSFESILCTNISHLQMDECGAPEKFLGAKLIAVPHTDGKLSVENLKPFVIRRGDQHFSQVKMVSVTQPTEYGTAYSLDELQALREYCDKENLLLHIDGARLGNAVYTLNTTFKKVISYADVVSMGGAKNGLMMGELVLINNPKLAENFKYFRKQAMQLPSKTRFFAAQFLCYLKNNLWLEIAKSQCEMALYFEKQLLQAGVRVNYEVQSNALFCNLSKSMVKSIREHFFFYVWDESTFECRLMTSFDTKKEDIDRFIEKLKSQLQSFQEVNHGKALS